MFTAGVDCQQEGYTATIAAVGQSVPTQQSIKDIPVSLIHTVNYNYSSNRLSKTSLRRHYQSKLKENLAIESI